MASSGMRIAFDDLRPGDLMFYDGDGDGRVDHVDVYIGNGWSLDSGSSNGGVSIVNVSSGWYRDHFVHGRRIIGKAGALTG
jgi:cell wall-associated NlpC family hydrolase